MSFPIKFLTYVDFNDFIFPKCMWQSWLMTGAAIVCSSYVQFVLHPNIPLRYPTDSVGTVPSHWPITVSSNSSSQWLCTIMVWERTTEGGYIIDLWNITIIAYTKKVPSPGNRIHISSRFKPEMLWLWILWRFKTTPPSDSLSPTGCYSSS